MSADNYIVICRSGWSFAAVELFASAPEPKDICSTPAFLKAPRFPTLQDAIMYAQSQYLEYGYRIEQSALMNPLPPNWIKPDGP